MWQSPNGGKIQTCFQSQKLSDFSPLQLVELMCIIKVMQQFSQMRLEINEMLMHRKGSRFPGSVNSTQKFCVSCEKHIMGQNNHLLRLSLDSHYLANCSPNKKQVNLI